MSDPQASREGAPSFADASPSFADASPSFAGAAPTEPSAAAMLEPISGPRTFGRYEIQRLLGRGGMGAVYLAKQLDLGRSVVIKVIADEASTTLVERLHREARAAAQVSSDHVVKVFDVGTVDRIPFIAMELVTGPGLDRVLEERKVLPYGEAVRIILDAARGLGAAHEAGILHRDVKPANILLTSDGRAKVSDFGLAKAPAQASAALTQAGSFVGTPDYMAPEQAEGLVDLDARADVYALGVTLYNLLTGCLPFAGRSNLEVFTLKLKGEFIPPRQLVAAIPAPIEQVCVAMMARDRARRPATMKDVISRLEAALAQATGKAAAGPLTQVGTIPSLVMKAVPGLEAGDHDDLPVPSTFGRYRIEKLLGRGGMGSVYLAREGGLDRQVVVKVLRRERAQNRDAVSRLKREASAAARIGSDYAVKVYDAGVEGGVPYIAMEYVDGISAWMMLERRGRMAPLEATKLILAAARGLKAAHDLGILHRDVKPGNIMITRKGRVKVTDFGLAKELAPAPDATQTVEGALLGSPAYMAPEQLGGERLDARTDVFALGVTYYELLTGELPWHGTTTAELLVNRGKATPPPRTRVPDLPQPVEKACLALMALDRDARPADMGAVTALLQDVIASLERRSRPLALPPWLVPASAATLGAAVVLSLAYLLVGRGPPREPPRPPPAERPELDPPLPPAPEAQPPRVEEPEPPPRRPDPPPPQGPPAEQEPPPPRPEPPPPRDDPPPPRDDRPPPRDDPPPPRDDPPPAEKREADARDHLERARKLAPEESAAELARVASEHAGTEAARTAEAEGAALAELARAFAGAGDEKSLRELQRALVSAWRSRFAALTGSSEPDARLEATSRRVVDALAAVALGRDLEATLLSGRDVLKKAALSLETKSADKVLAKLKDLDEKRKARGAPGDPRVPDYGGVIDAISRLRNAVRAAPETRHGFHSMLQELGPKLAELDEGARTGVSLAAAIHGVPLPNAAQLHDDRAKAAFARCLEYLKVEAPRYFDEREGPPRGPPR